MWALTTIKVFTPLIKGRIGLYLSKELRKQIHQSWETIPQYVCGQRKAAKALKRKQFSTVLGGR